MKKRRQRRELFLIFQAADIDIDDIELVRKKFDTTKLPDTIPNSLKGQFKNLPDVNVKTAHVLDSGKIVFLDLNDESYGTQKIFALSGPWMDTLEHGYVLFVDELHEHLHPLIIKFLIKLFHDAETNPNNAQLVLTTRDTSILHQDMFRRDQVWFCEKDESRSTVLFPLTDYKPRKKVENLERGYLSGRYGALPYVVSVRKSGFFKNFVPSNEKYFLDDGSKSSFRPSSEENSRMPPAVP